MNSLDNIKNRKYDYYIFLVVLFVLSLFMVCLSGPVSEYAGHDYFFNIRRFDVLIQALQDRTYPIYIDYKALEGYGYFTKGFYPDLIILPFAVLGIFIGTISAYNAMIFVMTFLCGLFTYKAVNVIFKESFVASISAILYTFSAYHLFDWYNRAALGESLSFTFLPIAFLGLYHIIKGNYKKWYILTIGYSLLIYTHLLSSVLTFITLFLIVILCYRPLLKEPRRIVYLLLAAIITLPIVGSYIFPMLEQMMSNTFYYSIKENITGQTKLSFTDLGWGFLSGIAYPKTQNMAGTGPLIIILVSLRLFVKDKKPPMRIADFCILIGVLLLIMSSGIFPWGRLPLGFIQFPWRLYEFIIFFLAIGGAYYLSVILKDRRQYIIASAGIILFTLAVFFVNNNNYKYWQSLAKSEAPHWFTGIASVDNEYYLGGLEYLPVKVPSHNYIHERGDSIGAQYIGTKVSDIFRKGKAISFDIKVTDIDIIELPLVYYKGYKAYLNRKEVLVEESEKGLVQIPVHESGKVSVFYVGTILQEVSWYISIISILALIVYICFDKRRKKTIKNE
ncbi:hypothetical protein JGH11_02235 [Dysgonomonas sp. Marseille-P4677]|uniref:hypothetical protein n=1 Tax=Dysgonomonas sp. Marseille-P4677 TaxID=2364790 RepID=UPI0019147F13|nr:hypothetical protein [Dysgonomonas sp. Marseille-P4677]MBK5719684.1 hypothetical protein [Dysgonomonas sp. Marseille-P4677]